MPKIEAYEGVHLIIEFLVASLTEAREELRKAKLQQPDSAHQAACSLATRVFKKHFSKDVEYASGKVTWGLCDTTAGVISQIDNMVCGLVEPPAQAQEDAGGWMRDGALLYRLTDECRPTNLDEIRVTMANGSRDIDQMSAQAGRLLVMLSAQAQPVTVPWENFPSYLIDHCEGDTISEEGLQFALSKMLSNPQYAQQPAAQAAPSNGALAAPAQPVAWALQWPEDSRLNLSTVFDTQLEAADYIKSCSDGVVVVPLYTAPQQAAHLAAKWQLVPRQLTQDMAEAAKFVDGRLSVFKYADVYRAMLYAAPQPAAQAAPLTHIGDKP